jgi:tetratricopeptide (TPR) repeat protein
MFAFPEYEYNKGLCHVPEPFPLSGSITDEIKRLDEAIRRQPEEASNYFDLADIFCWECMWLAASIDLVERGLELDPGNAPYRWLAIDLHYRFPSPEPNARHFEALLAVNSRDAGALYGYSYHCWQFTLEHRKAIKLLRRARDVEERLTGKAPRYGSYLKGYRETYWSEVAVYWSAPRKIWNFIWIFWLV